MSSNTVNQESAGGTMKNVIDNPETKPQHHEYAENQSQSNTDQGNKGTGHHDQSQSNKDQGTKPAASTHGNEESPGGTMKNVIDNPATKPQPHPSTDQGKK